MGVGSRELTRASTAYLVCLAFALTFLITSLYGGSPQAAVIRGSVVAVITRVLIPHLVGPVVSAVLDAMARDKVSQGDSSAEENG